jgi:hypothetical protein
MKISTVQTTLCVLTALTAGYIVWYMLFAADFQIEGPMAITDGAAGSMVFTPEHKTIANIARYSSILLVGLGITALAANIWRPGKGGGRGTGPIITQWITGIWIVIISVIITRWGYPLEFVPPVQEGGTIYSSILITPGMATVGAIYLTVLTGILGLAIFGVATAQLVKLRKA